MRSLSAALLSASIGCAMARPAPQSVSPGPKAPAAPVPLEEYFKTRRVSGLSFSHDEQTIAYVTDEGGRPDIWVRPIAGGPAKQITHLQGFLASFAFSPIEDRLVYEADVGGDELPHLFLTNANGDSPRDLAAGLPKGRRTAFLRWAEDGKTFFYLSSARDEKYLDLYEYDLAQDKASRLWEASGKLAFEAMARDGRHFTVVETLSSVNNNLYLGDRSGGQLALLTPHQGDTLYTGVDFSRDAAALYYLSDEGGEFTALKAIDLATKAARPILLDAWDVETAGFSRTWKYFYTVTNVDGSHRLVLKEGDGGKEATLPAAPAGGNWNPIGFSNSDRYLAAAMQSDVSPTVPYLIDLAAGTAQPIAQVLPPSLSARKMVTGESVRIPSFDDRKVPAFLYRPEQAGAVPAVIFVHGGPTSQSLRNFDRFRQYLVSKGYVVLVPNVRGSTGYGKTYTRLNNHDIGGGPLRDVVACKKWLVQNAHADPDKVVVLGGSYGGYMALAAEAFAPVEFAANVDYFGVSDLKSLVESFPPYWAAFSSDIYEKFGNPREPADAKYQHDQSPGNYVGRMERPLLVVQGDKDARVKKDQSDRIVEALRKRGVPVHYLVLENEGHGFSRNESYLGAYLATDRFLDRYLFNDVSAEVLPGGR